MTVLGIDSATRVCSAAIVRDGVVITERTETAPQRHAELLLPFVEEVMSEAKLQPRDLNSVAVSIGPGSFTGLRIGLSVAKGIAVGVNIPVVPVPAMDAAAFRSLQMDDASVNVTVILPARRSEYYYGSYRRSEEKPELIGGISVYTTDELLSMISDDIPDIIAGEGIERFFGEIVFSSPGTDTLEDKIKRSMDKKLHMISAATTGILSVHYEAADIAALEPLYIKQFESDSPKHKQRPRRPE
jgi:tRNA threonylcarbamoyladenosine biosynthesis protein TsaB